VPRLELREVPARQRARAHERHLAAQHVQHLRDLVEGEAAEQPSDPCHARVVTQLEEGAVGLVRLLQLRLPLGGVGVHRPELQHRELSLAEPDAAVAVQDRPARVELDRGRDQQPQRQAEQQHERARDEVERALRSPVHADERRRAQLEQRRPLAGHVVHSVREELGRPRRDPHLHAVRVRLLDQLEQLAVADSVGRDHFVDRPLVEQARHGFEAAEERQPAAVAREAGRAHEFVVDPASLRPEPTAKVREPVAVADEQDAAPDAGDRQQVARHGLVARAEQRDERRDEHERSRRERERVEVVVGGERVGDDEHRRERERWEDPPDPGPLLALGVQAPLPEHEHGHEAEERHPLRLRLPEHAPERGDVAVYDLP
jgi:hypothetical protein